MADVNEQFAVLVEQLAKMQKELKAVSGALNTTTTGLAKASVAISEMARAHQTSTKQAADFHAELTKEDSIAKSLKKAQNDLRDSMGKSRAEQLRCRNALVDILKVQGQYNKELEKATHLAESSINKWKGLGSAIKSAGTGLAGFAANFGLAKFSINGMLDSLIKTDKATYSLMMTQKALGQSSDRVVAVLERIRSKGVLTREVFAGIAEEIQLSTLGIPPSMEAIDKLRESMGKMYPTADEMTKAFGEVISVSQKVPGVFQRLLDIQEDYRESTGKGESSLIRLKAAMKGMGAEWDKSFVTMQRIAKAEMPKSADEQKRFDLVNKNAEAQKLAYEALVEWAAAHREEIIKILDGIIKINKALIDLPDTWKRIGTYIALAAGGLATFVALLGAAWKFKSMGGMFGGLAAGKSMSAGDALPRGLNPAQKRAWFSGMGSGVGNVPVPNEGSSAGWFAQTVGGKASPLKGGFLGKLPPAVMGRGGSGLALGANLLAGAKLAHDAVRAGELAFSEAARKINVDEWSDRVDKLSQTTGIVDTALVTFSNAWAGVKDPAGAVAHFLDVIADFGGFGSASKGKAETEQSLRDANEKSFDKLSKKFGKEFQRTFYKKGGDLSVLRDKKADVNSDEYVKMESALKATNREYSDVVNKTKEAKKNVSEQASEWDKATRNAQATMAVLKPLLEGNDAIVESMDKQIAAWEDLGVPMTDRYKQQLKSLRSELNYMLQTQVAITDETEKTLNAYGDERITELLNKYKKTASELQNKGDFVGIQEALQETISQAKTVVEENIHKRDPKQVAGDVLALTKRQEEAAEQAAKYDTKSRSANEKGIGLIGSQNKAKQHLLELSKKMVASEREVVEIMMGAPGMATDLALKQIGLMDVQRNSMKEMQSGFVATLTLMKGMGDKPLFASANQAKDFLEAINPLETLNEKQREYLKGNTEAMNGLVLAATKYKENWMDIKKIEAESLTLSKNIREGYLDAVKEQASAAGDFQKIIGRGDMAITQIWDIQEKVDKKRGGMKDGQPFNSMYNTYRFGGRTVGVPGERESRSDPTAIYGADGGHPTMRVNRSAMRVQAAAADYQDNYNNLDDRVNAAMGSKSRYAQPPGSEELTLPAMREAALNKMSPMAKNVAMARHSFRPSSRMQEVRTPEEIIPLTRGSSAIGRSSRPSDSERHADDMGMGTKVDSVLAGDLLPQINTNFKIFKESTKESATSLNEFKDSAIDATEILKKLGALEVPQSLETQRKEKSERMKTGSAPGSVEGESEAKDAIKWERQIALYKKALGGDESERWKTADKLRQGKTREQQKTIMDELWGEQAKEDKPLIGGEGKLQSKLEAKQKALNKLGTWSYPDRSIGNFTGQEKRFGYQRARNEEDIKMLGGDLSRVTEAKERAEAASQIAKMNAETKARGGIAGMHPGRPRGSDTVPAWLTPGELVVNPRKEVPAEVESKLEDMGYQRFAAGGVAKTRAERQKRYRELAVLIVQNPIEGASAYDRKYYQSQMDAAKREMEEIKGVEWAQLNLETERRKLAILKKTDKLTKFRINSNMGPAVSRLKSMGSSALDIIGHPGKYMSKIANKAISPVSAAVESYSEAKQLEEHSGERLKEQTERFKDRNEEVLRVGDIWNKYGRQMPTFKEQKLYEALSQKREEEKISMMQTQKDKLSRRPKIAQEIVAPIGELKHSADVQNIFDKGDRERTKMTARTTNSTRPSRMGERLSGGISGIINKMGSSSSNLIGSSGKGKRFGSGRNMKTTFPSFAEGGLVGDMNNSLRDSFYANVGGSVDINLSLTGKASELIEHLESNVADLSSI